ncbi:biotin/lipoyl-binding protein [Hymenobacter aerilatus]|uniref:Biotin/lipoyl-binding protein n=1 Tax=Hymenobacter aerilatus TaxID=2932251 RepID=A0A8T9SRF6_9BACT|nr:biotin/lipoyl-binding protein [Hymenobacter aerilatus]UOR04682.1 biotin/lipoyl-binding protein [Hymenobacter aerilatus]
MKKTLGFFFIPLAAIGSLTLPHWLHPHAAVPAATVTATPATMPLVATGQAIAAGVRGRLWQLYVVPGQHVRRGEVLAKMASTLPTQGSAPAALGFEYVVAPTDGTIAATLAETGTYLAATETVLLLLPTN